MESDYNTEEVDMKQLMKSEKRTIICADADRAEIVFEITRSTILGVYPKYYRSAEVSFFLKHHAIERILRDIADNKVYLCYDPSGRAVGTVTICDNRICRLFVLPMCQGKGHGGALMQFAEDLIYQQYDCVLLDTSLPGKPMYLKRGYCVSEAASVTVDDGSLLHYEIMYKNRPADLI